MVEMNRGRHDRNFSSFEKKHFQACATVEPMTSRRY